MKSWFAQGSSGRRVTLLPGTTFLHINGALDFFEQVFFHNFFSAVLKIFHATDLFSVFCSKCSILTTEHTIPQVTNCARNSAGRILSTPTQKPCRVPEFLTPEFT